MGNKIKYRYEMMKDNLTEFIMIAYTRLVMHCISKHFLHSLTKQRFNKLFSNSFFFRKYFKKDDFECYCVHDSTGRRWLIQWMQFYNILNRNVKINEKLSIC